MKILLLLHAFMKNPMNCMDLGQPQNLALIDKKGAAKAHINYNGLNSS